MKTFLSLIFITLALTMFGLSQSFADTAQGQKAKRAGLDTASPNQMFTQQLGTELILKSPRLIVLSYDFTKNPAVSGSVITFKDKYTGGVGKVPNCHVLSTSVGSSAYISTPSEITVSGPTTLDIEGGAFNITTYDIASNASTLALGYAFALTLDQGVVGCAGDTTITADILDGNITGGKLEVTLEAFPYNQTK